MATGGARLPLRDDWTCSVRRGIGDWPGYIAENCFLRRSWPVCTPAMAAGLRHPRDLSSSTLIVVSHLRAQWTWWFEAAGLSAPVQPAAEVLFENSAMAIKAVLDGVGVAVAQLPYVSDALTAGRLVAPFPIVPRKYESWYLAYRPIRQGDPALLVFRDWLRSEAELQRQAYERWALTSEPAESSEPSGAAATLRGRGLVGAAPGTQRIAGRWRRNRRSNFYNRQADCGRFGQRLRNLQHQFAPDGDGKFLKAFRRQCKGGPATNDAVHVIFVELAVIVAPFPRAVFIGDDGQPVDGYPASNDLIAHLRHRPAGIVRAVAGYVDSAPRSFEIVDLDQLRCEGERLADGRAPAETGRRLQSASAKASALALSRMTRQLTAILV